MTEIFPQISTLKLTDLRLRARYPWLKTRLFQISEHSYQIFVPYEQLDIATIAEEFNKKIRFFTSPVQLTNKIPQNYLHEINGVSDNELGQVISLNMTVNELQIHIAALFPDFPDLADVKVKGRDFTVIFSEKLSQSQFNQLSQWLNSIEPDIVVKMQITVAKAEPLKADSLHILPPNLRTFRRPYIAADENYWHENIKNLYQGKSKPHDIINIDLWGTKCLIDATTQGTLDLRQALLCYDTIILHLPLKEEAQNFRDKQRISDDDLATLAQSGRLRVIMQQAEEFLDWNMIDAILEASPKAIIGRRHASALIAADLVETSQHYLLSKSEALPFLQSFANDMDQNPYHNPKMALKTILWPISALQNSFESLSARGPMGVSNFNIGNDFGEIIKEVTGQDVRLEAMMFGTSVHMAHAFNATYIPPLNNIAGWHEVMRHIGEWMNFYRNFNSKIAPAWIGNQQRRSAGVEIMPAIPMFNFERHAGISDILDFTRVPSLRNKGRALISRLADLPIALREEEIDRLTKELLERDIRHDRRKMKFDLAKISGEMAVAKLNISIPLIGTILTFIMKNLDRFRGNPVFDSFLESIEDGMPRKFQQNHDLDFLSKIYRVAKFTDIE